MIYCVTRRVPLEYLKKVDEILVPYDDIDSIANLLLVREGKARVVIDTSEREYINWKIVKEYYDLCEPNCCQVIIDNVNAIQHCKNNHIDRYFMSFGFRDFYTMNYYINQGVSAVRLMPPLTHSLNKIRKVVPEDIEVRLIVNATGQENTEDSIYGGWFRPEDLEKDFIQSVVNVIEFYAPRDGKQESALYRIYAENKAWTGNLLYIIPGLSKYPDMLNNAVLPDFAEKRSICEQRCQKGEKCRYCRTVANLADDNWLHKLKDVVSQS